MAEASKTARYCAAPESKYFVRYAPTSPMMTNHAKMIPPDHGRTLSCTSVFFGNIVIAVRARTAMNDAKAMMMKSATTMRTRY